MLNFAEMWDKFEEYERQEQVMAFRVDQFDWETWGPKYLAENPRPAYSCPWTESYGALRELPEIFD